MPISHCFKRALYLQLPALNAGVAQLVERLTCNEDVVGSTPVTGSNFVCRISLLRLTVALRSRKIRGLILGGVPEWSKGADCKSAGSTFGGSNPPPSTINKEKGVIRKLICGCSSMVELQPSKLNTWVRFPSPAPYLVCQA